MKKERSEFIKANEVVALHVERYGRQIDRLLSIQAHSEEDCENGKVGKTQYYRERNKKIKAYSDAIDTMIQKERLLQFHTSGFKIRITEEKKEINVNTQPEYDTSNLTFDQQLELLQMMQKARKNQFMLPSITPATSPQEIVAIEKAEICNSPANINFIKREEAKVCDSIPATKDPIKRLREAMNQMAAKKFGEVGTLSDEEENNYFKKHP